MARLVKIVHVLPPDYDGQEGMDENGEWLSLLTNFTADKLEKYKLLIKSFNSHMVFGISEEAWGFYEDEGRAFKTNGYGLYISNWGQIQAFHRHEKRMSHVHKNRDGYTPGFIGYSMKPIKKPKTNAQRRRARVRFFKQLGKASPFWYRKPELNKLDICDPDLTLEQKKMFAKEIRTSLKLFLRYAKYFYKHNEL